jgi:ketosteroid isomerase-like protein
MKIIVTFFAPLFLAAMTFAQEESPAPSESTAPAAEEKPSATVEERPAEVAPAQKKEEPMVTPSPAAAKSAATSSTSPAKSAAASATKPAAAASSASTSKMTGKNLNPRDAENAWEAAVGKHDYSTVEGYVAADFTGVSSKNKFVNRSQMLGDFKGDKDTYKSAKNEKLNVQMYGNNVAVVTGRAREVGTGKDGKAFDRTYLFTDTWMMRGGKWQCVASQVSKIKG